MENEELSEFLECELITVPPRMAVKAQSEIYSCESCNPDAEIPFDWILADVMNPPGMYEFVLEQPAQCPMCPAPVTEKTLIERGGIEVDHPA